jgi:hypothetical protein
MKKCYYYYKSEENNIVEFEKECKYDSDYKHGKKHNEMQDCRHDKRHDKKHDCKHDKKEESKLVEFAYDTAEPILNLPLPLTFPLTTQPQIVAAATLKNIDKGNVVWLNGLYHVNNNTAQVADLVTRIYRNSISPSNLIYQSIIEIDRAENIADDVTGVVAQFVDPVTECGEDVTYFLTAQKGAGFEAFNVYVNGPITFTAAEIKQ